jgi:starch synthase
MKTRFMNRSVVADPRVLLVTPEISYVPPGMCADEQHLTAKAGGMADVTAGLIKALYEEDADVHVAIPDYRALFNGNGKKAHAEKPPCLTRLMPGDRIHLARDRNFFYRNRIYSGSPYNNIMNSLAFQREVINNIFLKVRPDLIHCHDWMTGLIPAMARQAGIPCLFTIHNIHSMKSTLTEIEDRGIDALSFWQHLFYESYPSSYDHARNAIPVDMLTSGVFAAHFVNTVSPTFLDGIIEGRYGVISEPLKRELGHKKAAGRAAGILNSPDPSYNPLTDKALSSTYGPANHVFGKKRNKQILQHKLGLTPDIRAPLFFWPSRLDPVQKGCQLLADVLYKMVDRYWEEGLQVVFIADGPFQVHFKNIVHFHDLAGRVAVCDFNEDLARLAYGGADFVLMPSKFEPCGLPQMIGSIYGALPVVHDTGGLHDTVKHLAPYKNTGNGFVFETYDSSGLWWAVEQAMNFYRMPAGRREHQVRRIMRQSVASFNHQVTARRYIELYEMMLQRPLCERSQIRSLKYAN